LYNKEGQMPRMMSLIVASTVDRLDVSSSLKNEQKQHNQKRRQLPSPQSDSHLPSGLWCRPLWIYS
jgi:hypothetical protein